ncbi:Ionotropic receptor 654 [Blattella germanica]|nr:Ionotropic receptor 654 [Blattella germanica]
MSSAVYLISTTLLLTWTISPGNTSSRYIASQLDYIIHRHFTEGEIIFVSSSNISKDETVDVLLEKLNQNGSWNILFNNFEMIEEGSVYSISDERSLHCCILFIWEQYDTDGIMETLSHQLRNLQSYVVSFNRQSKFIIVCNENQRQSITPAEIIELMWDLFKIVNVVVLLPEDDDYTNNPMIHLYTWFPYEEGQCGEVQHVVLIDEYNGTFRYNANLFPPKVPLDLRGCTLMAGTFEYLPSVILKNKSIEEDGRVSYDFTGYEIEYLKLAGAAMNATLKYISPTSGEITMVFMDRFSAIMVGLVDLGIGMMAYHSDLVPFADPTVIYDRDVWQLKFFVPCAEPVTRMQKILDVFSVEVWIGTMLISILSMVVLWRLNVFSLSNGSKESRTFSSIQHSFCNVFGVLLGVSVTEMPRTWRLRILVMQFICFSLIMNTVFQAFFVTLLVEPGFQKQITTLEDFRESGIPYCSHELISSFLVLFSYTQYMSLTSFEHEDCYSSYIFGNNISFIASSIRLAYFAAEKGFLYKRKFCSLEDDVYSGMSCMYFTKGHPLTDRMNEVIQRIVEADLVGKYWSELNWSIMLKDGMGVATGKSDAFFVFTLDHLKPVYLLLFIGSFLSAFVFFAEILCNCIVKQLKKSTQ